MANSVDPDQTAPICSGSSLFASILNSSVMLGNYLQQTTSTDVIFRCIFSWRFRGRLCSVSFPHGNVGSSAVYDCGISWQYSLIFEMDIVSVTD